MKKIIAISLLTSAMYAGGLFSVGHKNFGFSVGSSSGYGNTYTVAGANVNYFVTDNISIGVGYRGWFGNEPKINEVSIPITLYAPMGAYNPYIGAVFNHTMIDDPYKDYSVYGGRLGVAMQTGSNSFMSVGWVHEYRENDLGEITSKGYPEINAGFSF